MTSTMNDLAMLGLRLCRAVPLMLTPSRGC
jgi:hypothetical protein